MPFIFPTIHIYNFRTYVKYNSNTYKVKLLVSDYDCCAFNELGAISKSSFSSNKFCVSEMLHFIVVHMTILKHKNSPFFCTCCYRGGEWPFKNVESRQIYAESRNLGA